MLPQTLIIPAERDSLLGIRGEAENHAAQLAKVGVEVELVRYSGVMHGFFSQSGYLSKGKATVAKLAKTLGDVASADAGIE